MAKFCAYCGRPMDEGALFCGQCGRAVDGTHIKETSANEASGVRGTNVPPVSQKGTNNGIDNKVIGIAAVAVVAVILIIVW